MKIIANDSLIALAWDPVSVDVLGNPEHVERYRVYQSLNDSPWGLIGSVTSEVDSIAPATYFEVGSLLHDGVYKWAVTAMDLAGNESALHASTDSTAWMGGWYVIYDKTKPAASKGLAPVGRR
jgi:hypothetical protein